MRNSLSRRDFLHSASLLGAASFLAACQPAAAGLEAQESASLRYLKILATNDEHGWLEEGEDYGGADSLMYQWVHQEKILDDPSHHLVLSSGDLYTGPALSTWFKGESTVDVLNAMGYQAAAIGNHDFDYGLDNLRERAAQANFPLLSANIRQKSDGAFPDFALPYVIKEVNGVKVGLVGLTTRETPVDTKPTYVADFDFFHYDTALKEVVPQVRQAGADLIMVLSHLCTSDMRSLASLAHQLDIPVIFGGHCHEVTNEVVDGVRLVQSGAYLRGYTRLDLIFDLAAGQVRSLAASFHGNQPGKVPV
jgi:5'-nucleotidase/UDP-sugar diphosphatase